MIRYDDLWSTCEGAAPMLEVANRQRLINIDLVLLHHQLARTLHLIASLEMKGIHAFSLFDQRVVSDLTESCCTSSFDLVFILFFAGEICIFQRVAHLSAAPVARLRSDCYSQSAHVSQASHFQSCRSHGESLLLISSLCTCQSKEKIAHFAKGM